MPGINEPTVADKVLLARICSLMRWLIQMSELCDGKTCVV